MNEYRYLGRTYTVIREVLMKSTKSRMWVTAVLYMGETKEGTLQSYVREAEEFYKRFVKV